MYITKKLGVCIKQNCVISELMKAEESLVVLMLTKYMIQL